VEKMEDKTDEELARLVQNRRTNVFELLVRRYEERLLRYGRRFLINYEDIEDAVQDVFIKAYTNIQSFDPSRKFSSWIYRIAHNHFINIIKRSEREPFLFFDADIIFSFAGEEDIVEDLEKEEKKIEMEESLNKLKIKYREPIILYYDEDKDYQEISDILRIPVSTVGIRLKRGRDELKKMYGKRE
jgi:RNA polymerase sigma-70 factor, ECF subfamily